jgi:hypothetical protein
VQAGIQQKYNPAKPTTATTLSRLAGFINQLDSRLRGITSHLPPSFGDLVEWLAAPPITSIEVHTTPPIIYELYQAWN